MLATPRGERPYLDICFWTSFASLAGLPATTAPVGLTPGGLPVGVQIVGPYLEDATPIDLAGRLAGSADLFDKRGRKPWASVNFVTAHDGFTLNDLDLLTALANYAAVAVERARLNQKIVAEERKRERLGRFLSPQVAQRVIATSE